MVWQTNINRRTYKVLDRIFEALQQEDSEKTLELVKKELEICQKKDAPDRYGILLIIAGRIFYKNKNLAEYCKCLMACKQLFEKYPTNNASYHAAYYHWKGVHLWRKECVEEALVAFLKSEKALKEIDKLSWWDECNKMRLYSYMADMYFDCNFYEESKFYCDAALLIAEKNNYKDIIGRMLSAKGSLASNANKQIEAEQYYQCALAFKRSQKNNYGIAIVLFNLGEIAFLQKSYYKAIKYLNEILILDVDPKNAKKHWLAIQASTLNLMGNTYFELRENDKAEGFQVAALELINQTQNNTVKKKIYQSFCDLYEKQDVFEKAYAYSQKIRDLQHSELQHTTCKRIASLRIKYKQQDKHEIVKVFNQKVEKLEAANNYLGQIASSISHDVCAPIHNVIGYLGLLNYKYSDQLDEEAVEYLNTATDAAKDAAILVKSLSDLGKIELEQKDISIVSIAQIVQRVRRNLEKEIRQKKVYFHITALPEIAASEGQMLQLFQNLIANAIKYNENEQALITINHEQNEDGQHVFSVADNGIGIALKYQKQIFQILERLHGNTVYKGTGIGLAICSLIVKKHNGKIWVESDGKNGSNFKFTIDKW